jgi:hypothetical protein
MKTTLMVRWKNQNVGSIQITSFPFEARQDSAQRNAARATDESLAHKGDVTNKTERNLSSVPLKSSAFKDGGGFSARPTIQPTSIRDWGSYFESWPRILATLANATTNFVRESGEMSANAAAVRSMIIKSESPCVKHVLIHSPRIEVPQMHNTGDSSAAGTFVSHCENAWRVAVIATSESPSNSAKIGSGQQMDIHSNSERALTSHGVGEPSQVMDTNVDNELEELRLCKTRSLGFLFRGFRRHLGKHILQSR